MLVEGKHCPVFGRQSVVFSSD